MPGRKTADRSCIVIVAFSRSALAGRILPTCRCDARFEHESEYEPAPESARVFSCCSQAPLSSRASCLGGKPGSRVVWRRQKSPRTFAQNGLCAAQFEPDWPSPELAWMDVVAVIRHVIRHCSITKFHAGQKIANTAARRIAPSDYAMCLRQRCIVADACRRLATIATSLEPARAVRRAEKKSHGVIDSTNNRDYVSPSRHFLQKRVDRTITTTCSTTKPSARTLKTADAGFISPEKTTTTQSSTGQVTRCASRRGFFVACPRRRVARPARVFPESVAVRDAHRRLHVGPIPTALL